MEGTVRSLSCTSKDHECRRCCTYKHFLHTKGWIPDRDSNPYTFYTGSPIKSIDTYILL